MFDNHRVDLADHEYSVEVPSMYAAPSDDPSVTIHLSAHGGGTVGQAYAHNGWTYAVVVDGTEIITGDDLRTNATPATHAGMAATLANFLAAAGESLHYHDQRGTESDYADEYPAGPVRDFLTAEYERLSMFGIDADNYQTMR